MYGWRARVGLLLPMDNAVMEPELNSVSGLEGISFYGARLNTFQREDMPNNGIELSKVFNELGTDVIVYSCAETAFLKGVDGNQYISKKIEELTDQPAITAMSSMVEAANFLNLKKVSLVTPYTNERTDVMIDFFKRMGIEVKGVASEDFVTRSKDPREWYECNVQPPFTAYQMAKQADHAESEAIIISATNFRTFEIIEKLEEDLGKPVITTNQAILWSVFQKLNLQTKVPGLGKLLNQ
jgi:maleate isomerase